MQIECGERLLIKREIARIFDRFDSHEDWIFVRERVYTIKVSFEEKFENLMALMLGPGIVIQFSFHINDYMRSVLDAN